MNFSNINNQYNLHILLCMDFISATKQLLKNSQGAKHFNLHRFRSTLLRYISKDTLKSLYCSSSIFYIYNQYNLHILLGMDFNYARFNILPVTKAAPWLTHCVTTQLNGSLLSTEYQEDSSQQTLCFHR